MGNALKNASFLDWSPGAGTVANWHVNGSGALGMDEATLGGPGRAVLTSTGTASVVGLVSDAIACTPGQLVEAFGWVAVSAGAVGSAAIEWLDGSNSVITGTPLPVRRTAQGAAARGLRDLFDEVYVRATAPASTAHARLSMTATQGGGVSHWAAMLKPFLAVGAASGARRTGWDPGAHDNADLNLPVWPSIALPFLADSMPKPLANRAEWGVDGGVPASIELYPVPEADWTPRMRLTAVARDAVDAFHRACVVNATPEFWVVRPDTDQLCIANWLKDGAPQVAGGRGPTQEVTVGLHVAIA